MTPEQLREIEQRWDGERMSHWWCPRCQIEVPARNVTYHDECHDSCGAEVVWIDESETKDDIAALLAEVRRLNRMVDKAVESLYKNSICIRCTLRSECGDNDTCGKMWRKYLEEAADNG